MKRLFVILCGAALFSAGCGAETGAKKPGAVKPCTVKCEIPVTAHPPLLSAADAKGERNEVVFIGDSSTYGAGVKRNEPFPQLIDAWWKSHGVPLRAVNGGLNLVTTEKTLWRLDNVITKNTCAVFLIIGANDYWAEQRPIADIKRDYEKLIVIIKRKGLKLYLGEQRIYELKPGYQPGYLDAYNAVFVPIAKKHGVPILEDFFGIVDRENLRIPNDGHANSCGHRVQARMILGFLNSDWVYEL